MKKEGKYRFTLQFRADTEEQIQAGEFLERLGNKKSAVVVAALNEYLASRPEIQSPHCEIKIQTGSGYDRKKIEQMIHVLVEERFAALEGREESIKSVWDIGPVQISENKPPGDEQEPLEALEGDVAQMLDNLDMFL